jgi:hypothetical protein
MVTGGPSTTMPKRSRRVLTCLRTNQPHDLSANREQLYELVWSEAMQRDDKARLCLTVQGDIGGVTTRWEDRTAVRSKIRSPTWLLAWR